MTRPEPAATGAVVSGVTNRAIGRLRRAPLVVTLAYGILAAVFTGAFVTEHGLARETIWVELSVERPGWEGFFYPYDASRRLMSVPFHLAYLISDRSYIPLHVVNGTFVWLTGMVSWSIVRMLLPAHPFVALCAGAIALTHGADRTIGMVPLVQVRQSVVATLVAVLCLLLGWKRRQPGWLVPAGAAQGAALWTYEPALPLLVSALVLLVHRRLEWRRLANWTIGWLVVPLVYVAYIVERYVVSGDSSYQASQLVSRSVLETITLAVTLPADGLMFPRWPVAWSTTVGAGCQDVIASRLWLPIIIGAGVFLIVATAVSSHARIPSVSRLMTWLGVSSVLVFAAYSSYLFVRNVHAPDLPPGYLRVHYYAAPVEGFVLAALAAFLWRSVRAGGRPIALAFSTLAVTAGLTCGLLAHMQEERRWNGYRRVLLAMLDIAPRVKDDTFVALLGMPHTRMVSLCETAAAADPFLDTLWFNSALQLLYPDTRIAGSYWREDGSTSGAVRYAFTEGGVALERTEVTVEGEYFPYDRVLAFEFDPHAGARLLTTLPASVSATGRRQYQPAARIAAGAANSKALDRLDGR